MALLRILSIGALVGFLVYLAPLKHPPSWTIGAGLILALLAIFSLCTLFEGD